MTTPPSGHCSLPDDKSIMTNASSHLQPTDPATLSPTVQSIAPSPDEMTNLESSLGATRYSGSLYPAAHGTTSLPPQHTKGKGREVRWSDWHMVIRDASESEREELAYQLLISLPRSRLAAIQRRIIPLLQFDLVGALPPELSLQIFKLLPATSLSNCALVCKRWNSLANDRILWRSLCHARGWEWRPVVLAQRQQTEAEINASTSDATRVDRDEDEGMGDEEEGEDEGSVVDPEDTLQVHVSNDATLENPPLSMNLALQDYDFQHLIGQLVSSSSSTTPLSPISRSSSTAPAITRTFSQRNALPGGSRNAIPLPVNYKLLHQTQTLLRNRVRHGAYRLRTLPGADGGGHTAAVYCLALWSYDSAYGPLQVLFTGSKDRTVREWDLSTNKVRRKVAGMHTSSVLSLCVTATAAQTSSGGATCGSASEDEDGRRNFETGLLISGGSDCRVVVWDLGKFKQVKVLRDHQDSVLCVRVDGGRLVSCSKDRTIRTYSFPSLKPEFVLRGHRAAVNAVSITGDMVVSGSGDRSVRVWDVRSGALVSSFDDHHARAISSVELSPPFILSGSSDRHVRMFDMRTKRGWSTCPEFDDLASGQPLNHWTTQDGAGAEVPGTGGSFFLHSSLSPSVQQTRQDVQGSETESRICSACGNRVANTGAVRGPERHSHPVRSVAVGDEFVVSGSYDCTVKVWDKATGTLVADLTNGHTGRIFCVGQDSTKIVSCGEDQMICIWDFSHGIDTSFIKP